MGKEDCVSSVQAIAVDAVFHAQWCRGLSHWRGRDEFGSDGNTEGPVGGGRETEPDAHARPPPGLLLGDPGCACVLDGREARLHQRLRLKDSVLLVP